MRFICLIAVLCFSQLATGQGKKQITLEDLWKDNTFKVKAVPGFNAMKDGKRYTQLDADSGKQLINIYSLEKGKKGKTIFNSGTNTYQGMALKVDEYSFSDDEKKLLLLTESQYIYRRSILHKVYVFDIASGKIELLDSEKVLHASFSPQASKVAFVKNNNLYYHDFSSGEDAAVTTDGEKNKIINGNCDWVYEEEFAFTKAYQWSPDGNTIAYYRFDETNVPEYTMAMYGDLYPRQNTFKYPKAGEANSTIQIKLYSLKTKQTANADLGSETDQYIPRIKWSNDPNQLCIFRMNRLQNRFDLLFADATTGATTVIYVEENPYYINVSDNLDFLPDNASFIFSSEQSGYNHLYRWNWKESKLTRLTEGNYDVESIIGIDKKKKLVYYTAAEASPMERRLYSVNWEGDKKVILTPEPGMHAITPCEGYSYFLDGHSSLSAPPVYYLRDANGRIIRTLEDNKELKSNMEQYDLGMISLVKVTGDSGVQLNAWMIKPSDFKIGVRYPVLMFQYSGPGSQNVADKFPVKDYFWFQMLAEKGYIVVCADGTGTGFRGETFRKKTYLQLGKYESDDQIAVAKYLGSLDYVDKTRIGIFGWSYGGFTSATCMLKSDVFKMGIAVAPVTNWRFYDNIYTERYMRTPKENPTGYDQNAPEKMAAGLKGKLLIVHGTGDDNVHFQNSIMLVDALIKNNKDFDSEFYPNKSHGISGGNTRLHLYRKMTDYILQNL